MIMLTDLTNIISHTHMKIPKSSIEVITTIADEVSSSLVGQETLPNSTLTSFKKFPALFAILVLAPVGRRSLTSNLLGLLTT